MNNKQRYCRNCSEHSTDKVEHTVVGFVPRNLFEDTEAELWINATVCNSCGSLHALPITDEQMDWAERRFIKALVDTGNLHEDEARDILDGV